jgi:hypothetical protein
MSTADIKEGDFVVIRTDARSLMKLGYNTQEGIEWLLDGKPKAVLRIEPHRGIYRADRYYIQDMVWVYADMCERAD